MRRAELKIRPNDVISGSMYLKLIEDYRAYDARQKKVIRRLQTDLDYLMFENPGSVKTLGLKHEVETLRKRVAQLRKDNEALLCRVVNMQKQRQDG